MRDKVFVDTNLWVYLYSDKLKGNIVKGFLDKHFANVTVSTQILGELFNVLVKKGFKTKELYLASLLINRRYLLFVTKGSMKYLRFCRT